MYMKKLFSLVMTVGVIVIGFAAINNQQEISDWWYLRSYEPSAEIAALAESAGLSSEGEKYFFVSDPELNDKQAFNENCPFGEKTIVLGCYDGRKIYILDIDDPDLEGVETVTAAHEMLHAVYARLSNEERTKVDRMVNRQFEQVTNQRILDLVAEYDTNDRALINNELHSILPTELADLSSELEEYYDKYFDDRQKVVNAAKRYEAVFVALDDKIDSLKVLQEGYKSQISSIEARLEVLSAQIEAGRAELERLSGNNQIEAYNNRVPVFNEAVREYNSLIGELRNAVDEHNALVSEINNTAIRHNELVNTIDSKYQEL